MQGKWFGTLLHTENFDNFGRSWDQVREGGTTERDSAIFYSIANKLVLSQRFYALLQKTLDIIGLNLPLKTI